MHFQWKNIKWQCYWKLLRLQCWNLSIPSMVSTNQITLLFISNMGGIPLKYLKVFKNWFIILCTFFNTFMIYTDILCFFNKKLLKNLFKSFKWFYKNAYCIILSDVHWVHSYVILSEDILTRIYLMLGQSAPWKTYLWAWERLARGGTTIIMFSPTTTRPQNWANTASTGQRRSLICLLALAGPLTVRR